jgi:hypothetical protein
MARMFKVIENEPVVLDIPLAEEPLTVNDGLAFAAKHIVPLSEALVCGHGRIILLVQEGQKSWSKSRKSAIIQTEFYVGMFEDLLRDIRDTHHPELKPAARRRDMTVVAGNESKETELGEEFLEDLLFGAAYLNGPVEELFWKKITFGMRRTDGTIFLANMAPANFMADEEDPLHHQLFGFAYKLAKAVDSVFSNKYCWVEYIHEKRRLEAEGISKEDASSAAFKHIYRRPQPPANSPVLPAGGAEGLHRPKPV